jgi:hypothetical protein
MLFDHFETQISCEEFYDEPDYDLAFAVGASDVSFPDDEDDILNDDDSGEWVYEELDDLFDSDGGLTAGGQELLADIDAEGEFV